MGNQTGGAGFAQAMIWFRPEASEAIERAGYDPRRRELHIVFDGGRRYAYLDVAPDLFEALRTAESAGAFVNRRIKPNHRFRELEPARR